MKILAVSCFGLLLLLSLAGCGDGANGEASGNGTQGQGGSLARFMVTGDTLYTISGGNLRVLDISEPENPTHDHDLYLGLDIETLFQYEHHLFIGSRTGVYVYRNTEPANPEFVSLFSHARSCDPVVVQGQYAYVTLRTNSSCWGNLNQLDILDISDIENPVLAYSYELHEPKGLAVDGSLLFICDGDAGLLLFDISDVAALKLADSVENINCNDVIANNGTLIVTAQGEIYQLDYSSLPMRLLSSIIEES